MQPKTLVNDECEYQSHEGFRLGSTPEPTSVVTRVFINCWPRGFYLFIIFGTVHRKRLKAPHLWVYRSKVDDHNVID